MNEDYKIYYTIETGTIDADGNEYVDDYIDSGTDREGQIEIYIDIELPELRKQAALDREVEPGEIFFKRINAEKMVGEDEYIEDSITIDYEDESEPHDPPLTCMADLGDIDSIVDQIL